MIIGGIIIIIVAFLMLLFPDIFIKLKTPKIKKISELEKVVRIWASLWIVIGVVLIIIGLFQ